MQVRLDRSLPRSTNFFLPFHRTPTCTLRCTYSRCSLFVSILQTLSTALSSACLPRRGHYLVAVALVGPLPSANGQSPAGTVASLTRMPRQRIRATSIFPAGEFGITRFLSFCSSTSCPSFASANPVSPLIFEKHFDEAKGGPLLELDHSPAGEPLSLASQMPQLLPQDQTHSRFFPFSMLASIEASRSTRQSPAFRSFLRVVHRR